MEILFASDRRRQPIDKVRAERTAALAEIEAIGEATLSLDQTVARYLARLRDDVERAQGGVLAFAKPALEPDLPSVTPGYVAWLGGADFERQLHARLKELLPTSAMPQAERTKKLASLRGRLAELEEREEVEICKLEAQGLAVERRIDIELATVLGVWNTLDASAAQS